MVYAGFSVQALHDTTVTAGHAASAHCSWFDPVEGVMKPACMTMHCLGPDPHNVRGSVGQLLSIIPALFIGVCSVCCKTESVPPLHAGCYGVQQQSYKLWIELGGNVAFH